MVKRAVKCAADEVSKVFVYTFYTVVAFAWGPIYAFFGASLLLIMVLRYFVLSYSTMLSIFYIGFQLAILMAPLLGTAIVAARKIREYGIRAGMMPNEILVGGIMVNMAMLTISAFAVGMSVLLMRIAAAVTLASLGLLFAISYRRCRS